MDTERERQRLQKETETDKRERETHTHTQFKREVTHVKKGGWCLGFHLSLEQTALHRACLPTPTARYTPGPRATRVPRKARGQGEREKEGEREREREKREGEMPREHVKKILIIRAPPHAASSVLWSKSIPSVVLCGRPL